MDIYLKLILTLVAVLVGVDAVYGALNCSWDEIGRHYLVIGAGVLSGYILNIAWGRR